MAKSIQTLLWSLANRLLKVSVVLLTLLISLAKSLSNYLDKLRLLIDRVKQPFDKYFNRYFSWIFISVYLLKTYLNYFLNKFGVINIVEWRHNYFAGNMILLIMLVYRKERINRLGYSVIMGLLFGRLISQVLKGGFHGPYEVPFVIGISVLTYIIGGKR